MTKHPVYWGLSTEYPSMDFETYSEAGYIVDKINRTVKKVLNTSKKAIAIVGTAAYAEHSSTIVRSLAYDLKNGRGGMIWVPGMPLPYDLFNYIAEHKTLTAWNSYFEYKIWKHCCTGKMGWPTLPLHQVKDDAVKARAFSLPGSLEDATKVFMPHNIKSDGSKYITRFCLPRKPTKADPRLSIDPMDDPEGPELYKYNLQDINSESSLSCAIPDLTPFEDVLFIHDQMINDRGIYIDSESVDNAITIMEQAFDYYIPQVSKITSGYFESINQHQKLKTWLRGKGYTVTSTDKQAIKDLLKQMQPNTPEYEILKLRQLIGSSAVKKYYAFKHHKSQDSRARGLFVMNGADRTGRWASYGLNYLNQKRSGPDVIQCKTGCGAWYQKEINKCPSCGIASFLNPKSEPWNPEVADFAIDLMKCRSFEYYQTFFPSIMETLGGCIRGMFGAPEGKEIISSDFAAIEAVVMAELAQETWRQEVFRTHGLIYEMTAADITGVSFEEILNYKKVYGHDHPLRKKVGKVAELSGQFGAWIGGWKKYGAMDYFKTEDDLKNAILKWREKSPMIKKFWKKAEECFINAVLYPGQIFEYHGLKFWKDQDISFIQLLSGRKLTYHRTRVAPYTDTWGNLKYQIYWYEWNQDKEKGPINTWVEVDAWYGIIVENIVQATARDIQANSIINLQNAGYQIVGHTHDEIAAEILKGTGNIQHFEQIASTMAYWCKGWPVKMKGGWIGKRCRKN